VADLQPERAADRRAAGAVLAPDVRHQQDAPAPEPGAERAAHEPAAVQGAPGGFEGVEGGGEGAQRLAAARAGGERGGPRLRHRVPVADRRGRGFLPRVQRLLRRDEPRPGCRVRVAAGPLQGVHGPDRPAAPPGGQEVPLGLHRRGPAEGRVRGAVRRGGRGRVDPHRRRRPGALVRAQQDRARRGVFRDQGNGRRALRVEVADGRGRERAHRLGAGEALPGDGLGEDRPEAQDEDRAVHLAKDERPEGARRRRKCRRASSRSSGCSATSS
jgi:hypothetical protein